VRQHRYSNRSPEYLYFKQDRHDGYCKCGGGVGGLAAALYLHRAGHRITIYERFAQPKPLGSGLVLQPTGLGILDEFGLGETLRKRGARIDRLFDTSAVSGRTVLDVRYAALGSARGYAVHRAALFNVLFNAVKAENIAIETTQEIVACDDGVLVLQNSKRSAKHELVVDALGARSPLRHQTFNPFTETPLAYGAVWASLPWPGTPFDPHTLEQGYDKASVMIGVLPIGSIEHNGPQQTAFFWSLKTRDYDSWKSDGISAWKDKVLRYWPETEPLLDNIHSTDAMTLARYQHHTLDIPYGRKLICIGDSAHTTSPQLGQGANNALLDAKALTVALNQFPNLDTVAQQFTRTRRRHIKTYQALSYLFTPFYQSDSQVLPLLRDSVVSTASRLPLAQKILASTVAGTIVAPMRP
jgi:2-polyprenyl-6-methoxyphenol hydroxylase-like FAD-dependent oxidoreductase